MKMRIAKVVVAGVLAVAAGLAGAQDTPAVTAAKRVACGPEGVKFDAKQGTGSPAPAATPDGGKALVYLLTTQGTCPGCEATLKFGVDGSWVGATKGASWLALQVAPGEHHVCVNWQARTEALAANVELLQLPVESGKTYFLRARVLFSPSIAQLVFEPVGADEGALLMTALPKAEWKQK